MHLRRCSARLATRCRWHPSILACVALACITFHNRRARSHGSLTLDALSFGKVWSCHG